MQLFRVMQCANDLCKYLTGESEMDNNVVVAWLPHLQVTKRESRTEVKYTNQ